MESLQKVKETLKKYDQEHIIKILEKINKEQQEELIKQIETIDFDKIEQIYINKDKKNKDCKIEPINYTDKEKLSPKQKERLEKLGESIIKNNQYAVVTMAGGQGTRLGCIGPKGTYKLDIGEKGKYIFEILIDTLKRAREKYGTEVYWYIMTSEDNNRQTIDFFEENNYFGYNKEKVKFFKQGELPLIDTNGRLLLDKDYKIKMASNGNGSIFKSLRKSGMIRDMEEKNIKWAYICGVDNIMVNMVDTLLLGLAIEEGVQSASKSVKKSYPEEKVGIFCKRNGKPGIIEYIDMTEEMIYKKDEQGELIYGESNIVSHLLNIEALKEISKHDLGYHCAFKKNSYIDENGNEVIPTKPNSYKFESFIFDGFEFLDDMAIMRVKREEEFAPVKNATGIDSPETAKKIYETFWNNKIKK